jgi:hypothetical protein
MTFDQWYQVFWRGPLPDETVTSHRDEARTAWQSARAAYGIPETDIILEKKVITADPTESEYYQHRREKFWQKAYLVAYQAALTHPETVHPKFNRETENWAHNVAYMAAEEALFDADMSRKRGRLSYRYYF